MQDIGSGSINTTGLPALDRVLEGILPGDNIVWQVDAIAHYKALVAPFAETAVRNGCRLIYFRFADHDALLSEQSGAEIHTFSAQTGFEGFIENIHRVIEDAGRGAFYVFDCLSGLAVDWYSDQMLGNFFSLTCPFLFELETVTYFAVFRGHHSSRALSPIVATTQLFLNLYAHGEELFIHPIKVEGRSTPRMNMLHRWSGQQVAAVTSSAIIAQVLQCEWDGGMGEVAQPGFWERSLLRAEDCLARTDPAGRAVEDPEQIREELLRTCVSRDERIAPLALRHLTLADVISVRKRMIGSGLIGGKAAGMLIARAMLHNSDPHYATLLEMHDSFYVGSDVFYTFLVQNRIWKVRRKQRNPETFLEGADEARRVMFTGRLPDYILRQLENMLDYFGQSPFIVRSSSLLEDNFGNSFAGKYESVFCPNQGSKRVRMQRLLAAIRTVYASTMSRTALAYRAERGILDQDEQMALLVQRVSGAIYGEHFYPHVSGVGFSFNPYAWSEYIDPKAGVVRLVFGLGTRAVNRTDDDYTRIVALNAPERRPEADADEVARYAQHNVDFIDLSRNEFRTAAFGDVTRDVDELPLAMFASPVSSSTRRRGTAPVLTFDRLLRRTDFADNMRQMLGVLEQAYGHPVDVEFTVNFTTGAEYRINLLQCRPLQTQGAELIKLPEMVIAEEDQILAARCAVIGQSRIVAVDRLVYIVPKVFGELPVSERYEVARVIGRINRDIPKDGSRTVMLIGPGRWGTTSASLGVPVDFSEISRVRIVCELAAMRDDFVPDVSLGTHFLNDLVEMNVLYIAILPGKVTAAFNDAALLAAPNRLTEVVRGAGRWEECIRVVDGPDVCAGSGNLTLYADCVEQRVVCYVSRDDGQQRPPRPGVGGAR